MTEFKTIPIYSMKLAGLAMYNGIRIVSIGKNDDQSGRHVFFFYDTPELKQLIEDYKNKTIRL